MSSKSAASVYSCSARYIDVRLARVKHCAGTRPLSHPYLSPSVQSHDGGTDFALVQQGRSTQRSGRAIERIFACGAVSAGRGVLDVHVHRAAPSRSNAVVSHQANPGSIICADASRCEATDLASVPSPWATNRRKTVAPQAQRPSEMQLHVVSQEQEAAE